MIEHPITVNLKVDKRITTEEAELRFYEGMFLDKPLRINNREIGKITGVIEKENHFRLDVMVNKDDKDLVKNADWSPMVQYEIECFFPEHEGGSTQFHGF